jgi:endonuclease III
MASASVKDTVGELLERYPRTYAEEAGIRLGRGTPSPLFRLLVLSILLSARIRASIAVAAARALFDEGWTTPRKLLDAGWERRVKVLNRSGYARYDERTSAMLGDTCEHLLDRWGGDLRKLREEAGRDPARMRELLKEFKGIGDVGVDVFFRDAQGAWKELRPWFDDRALRAAGELGLPRDPRRLAELAPRGDAARLASALVRAGLEGGVREVRAAARE